MADTLPDAPWANKELPNAPWAASGAPPADSGQPRGFGATVAETSPEAALGGMAQEFGKGYMEGLHPQDPFGVSQEDYEKVSKIYQRSGQPGFGAMYGVASAAGFLARQPGAIFRGVQSLLEAMGTPKDVLSLPDAFVGSPHQFGMPEIEKAVAPVAKAFDDGVIAPAAQRLDSYARTGDPDGVRLEPPLPDKLAAPTPEDIDAELENTPIEQKELRGVLQDLAGYSFSEEKVENAIEFGMKNNRPDLVNRALKLAQNNTERNMEPGVAKDSPKYQAIKDNLEKIQKDSEDFLQRMKEKSGVKDFGVQPTPIRPIEGSPFAGVPRSVAAKTGVPEVDSVLASPVTKAVIDNAVIDRSHDVPYMAGGSTPLNDPTVYIDRHVPREQTIGGVTFDPAEPWSVHENVEQHTMEILTRAQPAPVAEGNVRLYRAEGPLDPSLSKNPDAETLGLHFTTNKSHAETFTKPLFGKDRQLYFVDIPKSEFAKLPVDPNGITIVTPEMAARKARVGMTDGEAYRVAHFNFAEPAEQAWYRAHGIDQVAAEKEQATWLPRIQHENPANPPPNLYDKPYPHDHVQGAQHEAVTESPPTADEKARAFDIIRNAPELRPKSAAPMLAEARELGVIGMDAPENINLVELAKRDAATPAEQAFDAVPPRSLSAAVTPEAMRGTISPREPLAQYEARFKDWISKIDAPGDVSDVIERAARENDLFPMAREGEVPASHVSAVAEAAGLDPKDIDRAGLATRFDSDAKVRAVVQALRHTTRDFMEASKKAAAEPTEENAAASLEAQERQKYVTEYTLGFRAESGRTLNAWKDLLRETERSRAVVKIKADEVTGKVPTGVADVVDAAGELRSNLSNPGKGKLGLQKLIDAAERLVTAPPKEGVPSTPLSPDVAGLVDQAKKTLQALKGDGPKSDLEKLVAAAEQQVGNAVRQKTVKKPTDALPPEWQALVDKADFVTKRFGGIAKGEEAAMLLARAGRTAAEQAELARGVEGLTPNQVARVLERLRKNQDPHWLFWSIQQGLISGLITHTKYAFVNTAQTFLDRVVAPEIAAIAGKLRGQDTSLLAPIRAVPAMFGSIPDAIAGVRQAFKTGQRVPLESELRLAARGEANPEAAGAQVPYGQQANKVNFGIWKRVASEAALDKAARIIGIPGRSANSIHTFFKIMNERASLGSRAWEMASKEEKPGTDQFWDRYQHHLDNPTDANLRGAVEDGYAGTFMEKLGEQTEKTARLIRNTPFKWLVFFTHIPFNMIRAGIKNSPLALLNMLGETKMGSALKGELGPEAQNLAYAHVAVGTAVGGYFIHKALSGEMNGDFPTDQKEKNRWKDLGIQPNTVKMDGQWVSMDRLGPIGMVARLSANYAHIFQHYDPTDDHAMMKATFAFALGTAKVLGDDVGFETIRNIVDVMENPREAARFAAWQLSSYAMPISLITQTASAMDPNMRVANNFVDGFKYHLPYVRETLPAKRDPIYGEPVPNPGYHSILRSSPINTDPVKNELDRLQYYPTAPERTIGHVKLTDEQYDRYEATAGPLVKQMLTAAINSPRYQQMPDVGREALLKGIIGAGRARARQAMQMAYPQLIQQGIDARRAQITGATP